MVDSVRALVRPTIAVVFAGAAVVLTFTGKLDPNIIGTATATIFGFYFGERAALKRPEAI